MHVRNYGPDYGRRSLLKKVAAGVGTAGVLTNLWPMVSKADSLDAKKAYPEELTSIEANTKGKVQPGDTITADNVDHVKHLLGPIQYREIAEMGRKIKIRDNKDTMEDMSLLFPARYLEATLRNRGKAVLDDAGNVRHRDTGGPWTGGVPFLEPESALEAYYAQNLSWGRNDFDFNGVKDYNIGPSGEEDYSYELLFAILHSTARADGQVYKEDVLRYNTILFTKPNSYAGASFLNIWDYDQRNFPDFVGYLPAFKRVRDYPTAQRFEPVAPGAAYFISDTWGAGDPCLTWGNYQIVDRKPGLVAVRDNWHGRNKGWATPRHGGSKGHSFYDTTMELAPEMIILEAEPTSYSRSPVGKKQVWLDARTMLLHNYVTFDRKGDLWKNVQVAAGQYVDGDTVFKMPNGDPVWSWQHAIFHDYMNQRITGYEQAPEISGGYRTRMWADKDEIETLQNTYFSKNGLRALGGM